MIEKFILFYQEINRFVFLLFCLFLLTPYSYAAPGVNRPALAWVSSESQAMEILDDMASEGVPAVRIMLVEPFERVTRLIKHSNELGLDVLLMIPLTLPAYYSDTVEIRSGSKHHYKVPPLSMFDTEKFGWKIKEIFSVINEKNLIIYAFQIDNEFNSSVFNSDLPVVDAGFFVNYSNYYEQKFWGQYLAGMNKLVAASKIIARMVRESHKNAKSPIVLGGLARPSVKWVENAGVVVIEPDLALSTLRSLGVDQYIDAYALHLYPIVPKKNWYRPDADILDYINERMNQVVSAGASEKPWWITEWGFQNPAHEFDGCAAGDPRTPLFRAFISVLASSSWKKIIKDTYIYDWDESQRFRIWNNNSVLCSCFRQVFE